MKTYPIINRLNIEPNSIKSYKHEIDKDFDIIKIKVKKEKGIFNKTVSIKLKRSLPKNLINTQVNPYAQDTFVSPYTSNLLNELDLLLKKH